MFQVRILPEHKLIIVKYQGEVTAKDMESAVARVVEALPDRTGFNTLSINDATLYNVTSNEMTQLMDWLSAHRPAGSKTALLVKDIHGFGLGRMWATHSEDRLPHAVQIFYDLAEACNWLGYDPAEIDQVIQEMD